MHLHIKEENIFWNRQDVVALADFGVACEQEVLQRGEGLSGTPYYLAPEVAERCFPVGVPKTRLTNNVDTWSLGITMARMLSGFDPSLWEHFGRDVRALAQRGRELRNVWQTFNSSRFKSSPP